MPIVSYYATAVRYNEQNSQRSHVDFLQVRTTFASSPTTKSRTQVVNDIESGRTVYSAFKVAGEWRVGAEVLVVELNRVKYLRTKRDQTARDNLENLPEF